MKYIVAIRSYSSVVFANRISHASFVYRFIWTKTSYLLKYDFDFKLV